MADYNQAIIDEFHQNAGQVGGHFAHMKLLLLHNKGAKSGKEYIKPLAYTDQDGGWVIVASKGGSPTHPSWYYNLVAHPDVKIEIGGQTIPVNARLTSGEESDQRFAEQARQYPQFNDYKQKTTRELPVFVLERQSS